MRTHITHASALPPHLTPLPTHATRAQIRQFVKNPAFDPMVVARSSKSAAVLGKWVIAMDNYQHVKKVGAGSQQCRCRGVIGRGAPWRSAPGPLGLARERNTHAHDYTHTHAHSH